MGTQVGKLGNVLELGACEIGLTQVNTKDNRRLRARQTAHKNK